MENYLVSHEGAVSLSAYYAEMNKKREKEYFRKKSDGIQSVCTDSVELVAKLC